VKIFLLGAALAAACFAQSAAVPNPSYRALVQEAQGHVKRISVAQLPAFREVHPDVVLIDVRETEEWAKGHAAGALHISKGVIERDIESKVPDKKTTIVLYCHSGARSALAAENLGRMGYASVYSLDGGLTAYESAGLPVEK